jgi:hypothetical protein
MAEAAYPPLNIRDIIMDERRKAGVYIENTASERQIGGNHYKTMGIEPWDVVDTWPLEQQIGYYRGGALKYIMRMGTKDENPQEIAKGQHYIEKLLEVLRKK